MTLREALTRSIVMEDAAVNLASAAPDMYAALKGARTKVFNAARAAGNDDETAAAACSVIDAALAKAEGRTP